MIYVGLVSVDLNLTSVGRPVGQFPDFCHRIVLNHLVKFSLVQGKYVHVNLFLGGGMTESVRYRSALCSIFLMEIGSV